MIKAQKVKRNTTKATDHAIIYGKFIQRLGFTSGGFPQDLRLLNLKTKAIYRFRVKSTFSMKKEILMCYKLPAGEYEIHSYWWTKSKWYGGKVFDEPILKSWNSGDVDRYRISLLENKIYYIGTWNFDQIEVNFKNEKSEFDPIFKNQFKMLDIANAKASIPY